MPDQIQYLNFKRDVRPKNKKTDTWQVTNKLGFALGVIQWFSPWRRYVFIPYSTANS